MKLAYLAYDKTALKALSMLEQYFSTIDIYLIEPELESSELDLLNLSVMALNVLIPHDAARQTMQHKLVLKKIKDEFAFLKKNIFFTDNSSNAVFSEESNIEFDEESIGIKKAKKQQFKLADISKIHFDSDINKYVIQMLGHKQGQDNAEYDHLIIEGHQLTSSSVATKSKGLISKPQIQSHVVLNLQFEIQYKLHKQHLHHEFIFIENTELKTIFDNWYLCSLQHNKMCISLLIPNEQYQSEEFLKFITYRVREVLCRSFNCFDIKELVARNISAADGFVMTKLKLNHTHFSTVFPSFAYWSQNRINDYIKNIFEKKNKKNKYILAEKEIS
ncbi:MAG: hypothetical protein AABY53_03990 [Bdellovibrionota bacterium]